MYYRELNANGELILDSLLTSSAVVSLGEVVSVASKWLQTLAAFSVKGPNRRKEFQY